MLGSRTIKKSGSSHISGECGSDSEDAMPPLPALNKRIETVIRDIRGQIVLVIHIDDYLIMAPDGTTTKMGGANVYGYVGNSPVDHVDPFGLYCPGAGPYAQGGQQRLTGLLRDTQAGASRLTSTDPLQSNCQRSKVDWLAARAHPSPALITGPH
jgi:hypothetical protein